MKLEFDANELTNEWESEIDLKGILRETVQEVTQKFFKKLVQEELDKVAEPVRLIIKKRADVLVQKALEDVRDLPETTILDALLYGKSQ